MFLDKSDMAITGQGWKIGVLDFAVGNVRRNGIYGGFLMYGFIVRGYFYAYDVICSHFIDHPLNSSGLCYVKRGEAR